ncbi:MAG: ATP-dependent helicase HrpB [Halocynthiibacter sp.]
MTQSLPIDPILPTLVKALHDHGAAVLEAPPGAGKTTRVPLALLEAPWVDGKIIMLEPRRLAARAAAERLASSLGEAVGDRVGYRMRGDTKVSNATKIEVVTEGILTRMIQSDPELSGIKVVIFDEFHERSLNADLGLALCLEIKAALREDLTLLAMSATFDTGPIAALMGGALGTDAPIITSDGRSFPVDIKYLSRPNPKTTRLDHGMAHLIQEAADTETGGILAFLPGEGEIHRVAALLRPHLAPDTVLHCLYGRMEFSAQRAALAPEKLRKIVLATSIAETSLTIPDIRVVVDAGLARRAVFDPTTGMSKLITDKASKAESTQRAGRAGRVEPGVCYRFWARAEDGMRRKHAPAEIEAADLSSFALELAKWGARHGADLPFLTPPPDGTLANAQTLLQSLDMLGEDLQITPYGQDAARLPTHPRVAHMLLECGAQAAPLAALLTERDPLRNAPSDLNLRLEALKDSKAFSRNHPYDINAQTLKSIRSEAKRLTRFTNASTKSWSTGEMLSQAYPDRIGMRRKGDAPRYVLSGGQGAVFDATDRLGTARFVVVSDLDGDRREAKVRHAAAIDGAALEAHFSGQITVQDTCHWSKKDRRIFAHRETRLGALVLRQQNWKTAPDDAYAAAACDGFRDLGLPHTKHVDLFLARVTLMAGDDWPSHDMAHLLETLEDWLLPHVPRLTTEGDLKSFDILPALKARLSWDQQNKLDQMVPAHFTTPMGRKIAIDYSGDAPTIEIRLQEMFGTTIHPTVGPRRVPLRVILTSPAHRPIQTTLDIPNFWRTSYDDVRKDMRGRYPKHPWPEDPSAHDPTLKTKRKGGGL